MSREGLGCGWCRFRVFWSVFRLKLPRAGILRCGGGYALRVLRCRTSKSRFLVGDRKYRR